MTKKVALITGANKSIGLETARQLGALGVTILVGARDEARGTQATETLKDEGVDAHFVKLDVTDAATHTSAAQYIADTFGRLDILINNAGILLDAGVPVSVASVDNWRTTFETNVFAVVALTQTLLPLIKKSDAGRIVNLSSILGSLTLNSDPNSPLAAGASFNTAYNASKAALNMFTIHLANELKNTPIKVNSVHPGWVKTDMGGASAPMELVDGAKTSVAMAMLPEDGPTGTYVHLGESLPW
ncbi:MAG TPA: SDR family oxidoreductase [Blastocatellia bacterium]|nr:SDR family oxidoreductase [Blastocatellia bacterium]